MEKSKVESHSDLFLKYNYAETKDMCKQFLTLVSAILVISLTFSDKVINFTSASPTSRWLIILSWSSLLLAIIFCGVGLLFITIAAGDAAYGGSSYPRSAYKSYKLIVMAGICFVLGLMLLIGTAITSINSKKDTIEKKQPLTTVIKAYY